MRILDVGQCGFDGPRMERLWEEELGAKVDNADTADEAVQRVEKGNYDVVLVNRVLAGDGSSGLEVIERLLAQESGVPVMLVSDLDDAQDAAVEMGAVRGFGKAELEDPATLKLVKTVAAKRSGGKSR